MKVQAQVNLHNRFDIEVRDAVTGELKQEAKAFNMVLDTMWTRLCAGSAYFANIHFGTGSGTLAKTRTALFAYLGTKTAVDDTLVKAIPNSSWKRKIVLNPEEFVGSVLSEVGVAYGASAANIVTHAMLEDAEGNPITITKTALDVITIYATVFVTFGPDTDDLRLIYMPSGNCLVNYLIGGASSPTGAFSLGAGDGPCSSLALGLESIELGSSAAVTWTSDTANKKRTTGLTRFGTTLANGHVKEILFPNLFRARLPMAGVFTGQPYTAVPIGTGDGVTREFILPSHNIKQDSITMKLNGVANNGLIKEGVSNIVNFKLPNPATLPPSTGYGVALSSDGLIMAVAHNVSPLISTYDWIGCAWVKRNNPATLPTGLAYGVALSQDGLIMAVAHDNAPFISTYDWTGGDWVKRNNPATLPPSTGRGVSLSQDGLIMAVAHSTSPFISTYDWAGGAWVKRNNPATLPPSTGRGVSLSQDGLIMAVAHSTSPFISTYDWAGGAWVKRANPATLPTGTSLGASLSSDGLIMAVAHDITPFISTYDWAGGAWIKRNNPATLPTGTGNGVALSPDGSIMAVAHDITPFISTYDWAGGAWVKRANPATLPTSIGYGVALSPDGSIMAVAHNNSPNIAIYNVKKRQTKIIFDTTPTAGVAITSDYTVDGVHKTDQYVLDVRFSIQFGEPV